MEQLTSKRFPVIDLSNAFRESQLDDLAKQALHRSYEVAKDHGQSELTDLCLLTGIAQEEDGKVAAILASLGILAETVIVEAKKNIGIHGYLEPSIFSETADYIMKKLLRIADRLKCELISTDHMLLSILETTSDAKIVLAHQGATHPKAFEAAKKQYSYEIEDTVFRTETTEINSNTYVLRIDSQTPDGCLAGLAKHLEHIPEDALTIHSYQAFYRESSYYKFGLFVVICADDRSKVPVSTFEHSATVYETHADATYQCLLQTFLAQQTEKVDLPDRMKQLHPKQNVLVRCVFHSKPKPYLCELWRKE